MSTSSRQAQPIYLHIGCGRVKLPGFINIDRDGEPDARLDVRDGLPFPPGSVQGIFSEHFIEHLDQGELLAFLRDCRRVLADGGLLRLATPDLDVLVREYSDGSWREQAWLRQYGYEWIRTAAEYLNVCMREWGHKWLLSPEELTRLLRLAGFDDIEPRPLKESPDPRLSGLETRERSFVLEARKREPKLADNPLVSLVIPAYRPDFFETCLQSALTQTYRNLEILVLDDSRGEDIARMVARQAQRDRRIRYERNPEPLGEPANLTKGIRLARGELIKPLYDDDVLLPTAVAALVTALRKHPEASLAACQRQMIDVEGKLIKPCVALPPQALQGLAVMRAEWVIGSIAALGENWLGEPSAMLFRRDDALRIDEPNVMTLFGRLCFGIGDVCLATHLLGRGDLAYVDKSLVQFRVHAGQTQRQSGFRLQAEETWAYFRHQSARLGFTIRGLERPSTEAARPRPAPLPRPDSETAAPAAAGGVVLTRIPDWPAFVAERCATASRIQLWGTEAAQLLPLLKARTPAPWVGVILPPEAPVPPIVAEADRFLQQWVTALDPADWGQVDALVCAGYLDACPDPHVALRAMQAVLTDGAEAFFAFSNAASLEVLDRLVRGETTTQTRLYSPPAIQALLEGNGWRIAAWYGIASAQFDQDAAQGRRIERLATDRIVVNVVDETHCRLLETATLMVAAQPGQARTLLAADPQEIYDLWIVTHTPQGWQLEAMRARMAEMPVKPLFHLGIVAEDARINALIPTLSSMGEQLWEHWRISIVARCPCPEPLKGFHPIVQWHSIAADANAVEALNRLLLEEEADIVGQLEAGDRLAPHALYAFADKFALHATWQAAYCDEDSLDAEGRRQHPHFKSDFDIDALRAAPYMVGGLWLMRREAYQRLGGYDPLAAGVETYDLQLRTWETFGDAGIGHIADVLYHRDPQAGHSLDGRETLARRRMAVVRQHLKRLGLDAEVAENEALPGTLRIKYTLRHQPLISILIPTRNRPELIRRCIESLIARTDYPNWEIILVDNGSDDQAVFAYYAELEQRLGERFCLLRHDAPFNYAAMMNLAAEAAQGEYLLQLNNDVYALDAGWLGEMLAIALRPDVGVVGARLLLPDGRIQHAGLVLGLSNLAAEHRHYGEPADTPGYFGRLRFPHSVSAVTGACLLMRRDLYRQVGGMDAERLPENFNDVDLCLKVGAAGYRLVWTPYATLGHEANASRRQPRDEAEAAARRKDLSAANGMMYARWGARLGHDPAYNRNLSLRREKVGQIEPAPALTWDPEWRPRPRVLAHPADRQGCGEYRIIAPMRALNTAGRVMGWETGTYLGPAELARMRPDAIILQRQVTEEQIELIERYREFCKAFRVFEIDDLITNVPLKSPVRQRFVEQKDLYKRFRKAVGLADRLVVSTEYLAEEYQHLGPPVRVVKNHLEGAVWLDLLTPDRRAGKPRVGWAGASQHHGDLAIISEVIKATCDEVDWVFLGMCLDEVRPFVKEFHPGVPIEQYPAKLASLDLDLAVAPLEDVPFNHAKSHLRLLEYGILGYPVVCTDLTPYRGDYPVTRVPNRFGAWRDAILERVRERDALRAEGERLRAYIRREWILEEHMDRWLTAWLQE